MPLFNLVGLLGISLNPLSIGKDVADAFVKLALDLFGSGASSIVTALLGFVTTTSDPVFSGGWWSTSGQAVFARVLIVSGSVMALAYMCSIITALLSGDRSILARATLRLPIAVLEMALNSPARLKLRVEGEPRLWPETALIERPVDLLANPGIADVHEPPDEVPVVRDRGVPKVKDVH